MKKRRAGKVYTGLLFSILTFLLLWAPVAWSDTTVGGTIATDTTWTAAQSPYIVTSNIIVQGTDGTDGITTLTIEPGVQVRFSRYSNMTIGGTSGSPGALSAQGTAANRIVFTSNEATPAPGDWYGLRIYSTADDASTLIEHCLVEYSGYGSNGAIYIYNAAPEIRNCEFRNGSFHDLNFAGTVGGTISGCSLNKGIYILTTSTVDFTGNTFSYDNNLPIKTYADNVGALTTGNTFINLDEDSHIFVSSGNVSKDATWESGIPIYLNSNVVIQGADGADNVTTLTIESGTELKFNSSKYIQVGNISGNPGALVAQGAAGDPVVFTSSKQSPVPGDWGGIRFYPTTDPSTTLERCAVEYTGQPGTGSIYIYNAAPNIKNTIIQNGSYYDLYYYGTVGGTVSDCTLNSGVYLLATNSTVNFSNNTFNHNSSYPTKAIADNVHSLVNGNNTFSDLQTAYIEVSSGNVTKDATWTSAVPIYFVNYSIVQGTDGEDGITTLTLDPGTTIRFAPYKYLLVGYSSTVQGALNAQGTAEQPVTFTSNQATPVAGDWQGIIFRATAHTSTMSHCKVQYAGSYSSAAISVESASPNISNTVLENNLAYDLTYTGTVGGAVSNCTFNNGVSLLATSSASFTDNTFNHNSAFPTKTSADNVGSLVIGNTYNNQETAYLLVTSGNITKDATWTSAVPIYFVNYTIIQGTDGDDGITTLTLDPGTTVRFAPYKYLLVGWSPTVQGALNAQGTAEQPVTFTSNQATPVAGDWQGIIFRATAHTSTMSHCKVQYAGSYSSAAISVESASPNISNTVLENNLAYDLTYTGTVGGAVSNCTFNNGVSLLATSSASFTDNTFNHNSAFPTKTYADNVGSLVTGNTYNNPETAYIEVTSGNVTKDATWTSAVPIYLFNYVIVQGTDGADGITTLTLQPGTTLKFNGGKYLYVGSVSGSQGALVAQGTADNPVVFTSNKQSPASGDWYGITFQTTAHDESSFLDYCIVEYAIDGSYLINKKPKIRANVYRYNSNSGLKIHGSGSDEADIQCNTFKNNKYGIFSGNNALPEIKYNNFINNTSYGLYNASSLTVTAKNNWWADTQGPNQAGDRLYGNVDADPWSTTEHQCLTGTANNPPHTPSAPSPADNAVRITIEGGITLAWSGGDPDPLDTVVYDLLTGTTVDTLMLKAQGLQQRSHLLSDLIAGQTYYWQVIARDDQGLESEGPIWSLTTNGDPPDLIISALATDPPGHLQTGQMINLIATVQNIGNGPAVDPFTLNFEIDGGSIGTASVDVVILAGHSFQVSRTWIYGGGDPTVGITADDQNQVSESNEQNNLFATALNEVADNAPPVVTQTWPADGASISQVPQILVTLFDSQGLVDDEAVMASFSLVGENQEPVVESESSDTFTFIPNTLPLADGPYQVTMTAADTYGNAQNYGFGFTIDSTLPQKPVITGASVDSGTIQPRPFTNTSSQFAVTLTGTREAGTSVWINGEVWVDFGDTEWSVQLVLQPDDNAIEVWLKDRAGNQGPSEWVDIQVTTAGAIGYNYDATGRVKRIHSNP